MEKAKPISRAIALAKFSRRRASPNQILTALIPRGVPANQAALFDVDIHTIPARKTETEHLHLDLRFAWIASEGATPRLSEESRALDSRFPLEKPPGRVRRRPAPGIQETRSRPLADLTDRTCKILTTSRPALHRNLLDAFVRSGGGGDADREVAANIRRCLHKASS